MGEHGAIFLALFGVLALYQILWESEEEPPLARCSFENA
jgi:hypothetical protein